jgi:hypothetical protein
MVAVPLMFVQAFDAEREKLLTFGFELDTEIDTVFPVKLVTVQLLLVTTPEMVNVVVATVFRLFVLNEPAPLTNATIADPLDAEFVPEKV